VKVTLATGLPRELCERIGLGYRDPASIDVEAFAGREDEGVLLVRKAGEQLYRLQDDPGSRSSDAVQDPALELPAFDTQSTASSKGSL
jgi:hypothetical protein